MTGSVLFFSFSERAKPPEVFSVFSFCYSAVCHSPPSSLFFFLLGFPRAKGKRSCCQGVASRLTQHLQTGCLLAYLGNHVSWRKRAHCLSLVHDTRMMFLREGALPDKASVLGASPPSPVSPCRKQMEDESMSFVNLHQLKKKSHVAANPHNFSQYYG